MRPLRFITKNTISFIAIFVYLLHYRVRL